MRLDGRLSKEAKTTVSEKENKTALPNASASFAKDSISPGSVLWTRVRGQKEQGALRVSEFFLSSPAHVHKSLKSQHVTLGQDGKAIDWQAMGV
jgi:hypothetical protein